MHAVVHLPASRLLDEVGPSGRLLCYARAGLARSLALAVAAGAAVLVAASLWRGSLDLASAAAAAALVLVSGAVAWHAARARWLELGEIEIALWDAPGGGAAPAELYSHYEALVRERRRRGPPWRAYGFAPVLVLNPLALGDEPDASGRSGRLRRLLPTFAALGGRPRALIALSRWSAVEAACRSESDRASAVEVRAGGMGGAGSVRIERELLRRHCLDAEDGREGDVYLHHLRYDAGAARVRRDEAADDEAISVSWDDPLATLEGDARRSAFRFLASLIEHRA